MRSVQINTPPHLVDSVAELAFETGVGVVSLIEVTALEKDGSSDKKVNLSFESSTPKAKKFVDRLLSSSFYDRENIWIDVRERRSIINRDPISDITYPWVIPSTDVLQDLYQFSHITGGLVVRLLVAGLLLGYGLLNQNVLLMIAGMMFIPLLPVLLGIGFSAWVGHWRLTARAVGVLAIAMGVLYGAGLAVGAAFDGPVRFTEFPPRMVGVGISLAVGVAAALANTDDVGRRELIGLAATSQIAVLPAWLGLYTVLGLPASENARGVEHHVMGLMLNIVCVVLASLATYLIIRAPHPSLRRLNDDNG